MIDTHVWIWLNLEPERLSRLAHSRLVSEPGIAMSTLSIYETMMAVQRGRVPSIFEPDVLVSRWLEHSPVMRIPVTDENAILSRKLDFTDGDPFDRIIASTAFYANAPLMTADRNLIRLDWLTTIPAA